ncbi:hypothetical protein B0T24DRAFT_598112 [Lasiosphaeria ovina]|uniref:Uncharacterized protein n=1 Tax=Lasiosphaeria ovina TaxID=92902 RepID=A0AAE0JVJ7_9PEZI|nr:hypothetical protein B0T24DRAFT_598112 [Lasiosphaeria ovina]
MPSSEAKPASLVRADACARGSRACVAECAETDIASWNFHQGIGDDGGFQVTPHVSKYTTVTTIDEVEGYKRETEELLTELGSRGAGSRAAGCFGRTQLVPLTHFNAHNQYITRILLSPDVKKLATPKSKKFGSTKQKA